MEEVEDVQSIFYVNKISEILSVNFYLEYRCTTARLDTRLYSFLD